MIIGVFKSQEISYEKRLEAVFYKNDGKSHLEIASIVRRSRRAALALCKTLFKSSSLKNLLRFGRPEKFTKVFDRHVCHYSIRLRLHYTGVLIAPVRKYTSEAFFLPCLHDIGVMHNTFARQ